ncbi:MAG: dual specificity protein phosphatase family protein [Anaerolineae bacterium]|nr:dual specificity protein phosphatase family protein [Anaerolineae bacterium]
MTPEVSQQDNFLTYSRNQLNRLWNHLRSQGIYSAMLSGVDRFVREYTGLPYERFSRITPQIYLGGQPQAARLKALAARGITAVVNMRSEYQYPQETQWGAMKYLHLPTTDHTAPTLDHLFEGVTFIEEQVAKGGKVYIHCWEGLGRGPSMTAAYFISQGLSLDEALAKIRRVRRFIHLTPEQLDQLKIFSKALPEYEAEGADFSLKTETSRGDS